MKKLVSTAICALSLVVAAGPSQSAAEDRVSATIPYGANEAASGTFVHNGVTSYYEVYGAGPPLLLVHGNGGSIGWLASQIEFFKKTNRVIVMDSRDQWRSRHRRNCDVVGRSTDSSEEGALLCRWPVASTYPKTA